VVRYQLIRRPLGGEVSLGRLETMLFDSEDKALKFEEGLEHAARIVQRTHQVVIKTDEDAP
jgi:hypothetical protein